MPRINKDDLEYCSKFNKCLDCYREEKDVQALCLQQRRKLLVPCCQKHFGDHEAKIKHANATKYARQAERRQKAGLCVSCGAKLIPQDLLPSWRRGERTCGRHGRIKAFQINRIAMLQYIMDHCLPLEQRKNAEPQNIVYQRGDGLAFTGIQYPHGYVMQTWSAFGLVRLVKESHSQKPST